MKNGEKMRSKSRLGIVLVCIIFLPACTPKNGPNSVGNEIISKYEASAENVRMLKSTYSKANQKIQSLAIGKSKIAAGKALGCNYSVNIRPPGGLSFEQYILGGLVDELKFAGLLSEQGTHLVTAVFTHIFFDSGRYDSGRPGFWVIRANFSTRDGTSFLIHTRHEFESFLVGSQACVTVVEAFPSAVRQFIQDVTHHETFKSLLN